MLIKIKVVSKQSERFSLSTKFNISVLDFEKVQKCQLFFRFPPRMCNFEAFSGVSRSNIVRYAKCLKCSKLTRKCVCERQIMKTKRKLGFNHIKVVYTFLSATDFFEKFRDSHTIRKTHNYGVTVSECCLMACILHTRVRKFRFLQVCIPYWKRFFKGSPN